MLFVKWVDRLNKWLIVFLAAAFMIMTLTTFLNILVRFVFTSMDFQFSVPWTEEVARYLMIWSIFVGGAVAVRKDQLITVEALVHALPSILGKVIKIGALLFTIVFFIYLIVIGYDLAFKQGFRQTSPIMGLPMMFVYISMLVGAIIAILNIFALIIDSTLTKKDIRYASMEEEKEELAEFVIESKNT